MQVKFDLSSVSSTSVSRLWAATKSSFIFLSTIDHAFSSLNFTKASASIVREEMPFVAPTLSCGESIISMSDPSLPSALHSSSLIISQTLLIPLFGPRSYSNLVLILVASFQVLHLHIVASIDDFRVRDGFDFHASFGIVVYTQSYYIGRIAFISTIYLFTCSQAEIHNGKYNWHFSLSLSLSPSLCPCLSGGELWPRSTRCLQSRSRFAFRSSFCAQLCAASLRFHRFPLILST